MSSSEIPCLRALARISTPTTLVVNGSSRKPKNRRRRIGPRGRSAVRILRSRRNTAGLTHVIRPARNGGQERSGPRHGSFEVSRRRALSDRLIVPADRAERHVCHEWRSRIGRTSPDPANRLFRGVVNGLGRRGGRPSCARSTTRARGWERCSHAGCAR
jgi:hypothetical protein